MPSPSRAEDFIEAELATLAADPTAPRGVERVRELLAAGAVATAAARHHAAVVIGCSDDPQDVARAHDLALGAMAGHRPARRLAAELYDRQRQLAGQAQKFGTWPGPDGAPAEVDPATTDSERAKWDLPSLDELRRRHAAAGSCGCGDGCGGHGDR